MTVCWHVLLSLRNDGTVPRLFRATLHKRCLILKLGLHVETLQAPCLPPSLVQGRGCWEGLGRDSQVQPLGSVMVPQIVGHPERVGFNDVPQIFVWVFSLLFRPCLHGSLVAVAEGDSFPGRIH